MVIRCSKCGIPLTRHIKQLTDDNLIYCEYGQPAIPEWLYWVSDDSRYPDGWVVNLADLVNTQQHPDPRRLNGCCGLDGCDGINRVCTNGHEIGTERSDCWWAHGLHFDWSLVEVKEI